mgnify:CR=1 FL=1
MRGRKNRKKWKKDGIIKKKEREKMKKKRQKHQKNQEKQKINQKQRDNQNPLYFFLRAHIGVSRRPCFAYFCLFLFLLGKSNPYPVNVWNQGRGDEAGDEDIPPIPQPQFFGSK